MNNPQLVLDNHLCCISHSFHVLTSPYIKVITAGLHYIPFSTLTYALGLYKLYISLQFNAEVSSVQMIVILILLCNWEFSFSTLDSILTLQVGPCPSQWSTVMIQAGTHVWLVMGVKQR